MVVLLFVVYEVYVTDLFGSQKQAAATEAIDQVWASAEATTTDTVVVTDPNQLVTDPRQRTPTYETLSGEGFAKLYIPAFGADYRFTVVEGTNSDDLYIGPGHYAGTQMPGQQGNFAVAGHRVSKGSPFNDLGLLASCDAVVVETQDDWFVYRVLPMQEESRELGRHPARALRRRRRADRSVRGRVRPGDHRADGLRAGAARPARRLDRGPARCPAGDHPDHLPPAVLRPGTDDHPRGADAELREGTGFPAARARGGLTCTSGSGGTCRGRPR